MSIQTTNSGRALADGVFDFLSQLEQAATAFNGSIHNDGVGVPTLGYGYALVVRANGLWAPKTTLQADLASVGIALTPAQLVILGQIVAFQNQGNTAAAGNLIPQLASGVQPISQQDGRTLFDVEVGRHAAVVETRFRQVLGNTDGQALYATFANTRELEALVSLAYNGAGTIGPNLINALQGQLVNGVHVGNRAEAWYQIRYQTNNSAANVAAGISKRRFVEAQILGLYHDESAPTAQEARDAMQMLTSHRDIIMAYEGRFGARPDGFRPVNGRDMIDSDQSAANVTFGGTALYEVDTLTEALTPARNAFIAWLNASGRLEGQANLVAADWHPTAIYYDPGSSTLDATGDDAAPLIVVPGLRNNLLVGRSDALNTLRGGAGDDYLVGGTIADTLEGGSGADTLIGGAGVDTLRGGAGVDRYVYRSGDGTDIIAGDDNDGVVIFDGVTIVGNGATAVPGADLPTWQNNILGTDFFFRRVNTELIIAREVVPVSQTAG